MRIIAELGSNFKSFDDCKTAISLAKSCGADAIKFQLYTHQELYGFPGTIAGELPRDWLPRLKDKADAVGIELMCTAFSPDGVRFVDAFVDAHKVASSEACHVGMLDVLLEIKKPTIISVGAQSESDVIGINKYLENHKTITFLYCEASYPAQHVDMRKMLRLREITNRDVGYSDHTLDVYNLPRFAYDFGATVLEKHFNPFDYTDTPDAPHSLSIDDFQAMVYSIKEPFGVNLGPTKAELPMLLKHKRRLIATQSIKSGDQLRLNENYGIYRSKLSDTKGAHPAAPRNNTTAKRDYNVGDAIE